MRVFFVLLLGFLLEGRIYSNTLSQAIEFISKKDYSNAIEVLTKLQKTKDNERTINYYLCEVYFVMKDFENSIRYGEEVINGKKDFFYAKSLYNVVFSSYILNVLDKVYFYGIEYLDNVGDSHNAEEIILTMVLNSLQLSGNKNKFVEILNKYKKKYPTLYSAFYQSMEIQGSDRLFQISKEQEVGTNLRETEVEDEMVKQEKVKEYIETLKYIISSLEKISQKKDMELQKLNDIIELLELKEEALKIKKYRVMLGE
ncbi:MAG: hypothetical protein N2712_02500 [Brevinematales bacterium]|nr:hypothetical protein [Brevinematales bacterium]